MDYFINNTFACITDGQLSYSMALSGSKKWRSDPLE